MANSIELCKLYDANLQKIWKRDSLTSLLENGALVRTFEGAQANEVKLPKMSVSGLSDYDKANGYASGSATLEFETRKLEQDRGKKFLVDAMDDFESLGIVVGSLLSEFQRTQVVPEVDAYRFAKIAQGSATANRAYAAISAGSTATSALDTAVLTLNNAEVPMENRVLFCTPAFYQYLKSALDSKRFFTANEGVLNRPLEYLDGMQVVMVPSARFYVGWKKGTSEGYANDGSAINFMIVHKDAVLPVTKHNPIRAFSPDQNQDADAWKFNYRLYHDCFVMPNKESGIYVHTATAFAATTTVTPPSGGGD